VVGPTALQQRRAQPPDGLRGTVVEHGFRPSVDILFGTPRFEYGSLVGLGLTSHHANRIALVEAPRITLAP
jgi:hypothetical protein